VNFSIQEVFSRPYRSEDFAACLAVFETNLPKFFTADERNMFQEFLNGPVRERPYLVLEYKGEVIGCGGMAFGADRKSAFLSWGMVSRPFHGKGVGKVLTEARLELARAAPEIERVTLNTSQHTQGFYAKYGFQAKTVTPDGYGPGLDRWDMVLNLR